MNARVQTSVAFLSIVVALPIVSNPALSAQTMQPTSVGIRVDPTEIRQFAKLADSSGVAVATTSTEWSTVNAMLTLERDTIAALVRGALANPVVFAVWAKNDSTKSIRGRPQQLPLGKALRMVMTTLNLADLIAELATVPERDRQAAALIAEQVRQKALAMTNAIGFVPKVSVFLEGNVKALASGTAAKGTAANGTMGLFVERESFTAAGAINVASTVDSVTDGFATLVLSPANGKGLLAGVFDVRQRMSRAGKEFCLHYYLAGSQSTWYNFATDAGSSSTRERAAIWGLGALGSWDILADVLKESPVALTAEGGIAVRAISGDIARNAAFRERIGVIGDSRKLFGGLELGMKLQYKDFIGAMQVYRLNGHSKGISGLQLVGGISARTSILSGEVGKAKTP